MAKKRQAILNAATFLFAEKGFNETSIAEVARMTQAAEGTIFYHFKTKNDLFLAVLSSVKEGISSEFEAYLSTRRFDTGREMIGEVIAFFFYLAAHHEEWFMLIQRHYAYELAKTNVECRGHLEAIFNTLIDLFEAAIHRGQEDGSIGSLPTRKTALVLFSMVNGLVWFKFHNLYDPASLYEELQRACHRILSTGTG
jgi:AcrR family transcriptional regulator